MTSNTEETWGLAALKLACTFISPALTKVLPQLSITKRGKDVLSTEPGTGVKPMAKKGTGEWRKEGMQRNTVRLTG